MHPTRLDHVALWVADRDPIAERCVQLLGMHVIDRQEDFTLVGSEARHGKLTLFDAEGPREPGALVRIGLKVSDLAQGRALLPEGTGETFDLGEGIMVTLVERETEVEYDLDHVVLRASSPEAAALEYERLGFLRRDGARVEVGGAYVELVEGDARPVERPLLNHLAVLVDSADDHEAEARRIGVGVESTVDAENTRAVFLWAPDGVRIEYVEHKSTFSLT
jgi:catechol 2,3-dioxygenase-like lactoylglutathione lyase family enzyme